MQNKNRCVNTEEVLQEIILKRESRIRCITKVHLLRLVRVVGAGSNASSSSEISSSLYNIN